MSEARRRISHWAVLIGITETEIYDVLLAFGEVVTNAVQHGNYNSSEEAIFIECVQDQGDLSITVRSGGAFNLSENLACRLTDIDCFQDHGRGFAIMQAIMDRVETWTENNRTIVCLYKNINVASESIFVNV